MEQQNKVLSEQQEKIDFLVKNLDIYQDFPKPGITFRDTMSLFRKPETFRIIVDLFADRIMQLGAIDAVVGLESRGFIIGAPVCYKLGIPFVVVRKKGKLPGKKLNVTYELEYGQDAFEIQENALKAGQRVVIIDDLMATGGTCAAAIQLCEMLKAEVVECIMLIEFVNLNWRSKVKAKTSGFIKLEA